MTFTSRQLTVLRGVCNGHTLKAIASDLGVSEKTVDSYYMQEIYRRTGVRGIALLTRWAIRNRFIKA